MKTKNLLTLMFVITASQILRAQQFPYFNHVYLNQNAINPSLTGIGDQAEILLIQKNTLTGIPGNPRTLYLNATGPIKTDKVGVGISIYKESLGITSKTGVYGSYAYKLKLDENQGLNFGLTLGALQLAIDPDITETENALDPVLVNKTFRSSVMDGAVGAFYNNRQFEAGLAVLQIFGNKAELTNNVNFNMQENVVASLKYKIYLNSSNDFSLSPMLVARYSQTILPQDVYLVFNYRDKFWFTPFYSSAGVIGGSVSMQMYDRLRIGYANETYIKQPVRGNQRGGHEIMVSFAFDVWSKAFKKQQQAIDQLYNKLAEMKMNQMIKDSLQDQNIQENKEAVVQNEQQIQKTSEELEKLKKELIEAGLIREFPLSEYDNAVPGYYIVIASVSEVGYSQKAMDREYLNQGYKKVFNKKRGWHYVYTVKPDDFATALKILKETRAGKHKDAWIHILK